MTSRFGLPVGEILNGVINDKVKNAISSGIRSVASDGSQQKATFTAFNSAEGSARNYTQALDLMKAPSYPLVDDAQDSGFFRDANGKATFVLIQMGQVLPDFGPRAYRYRKSEIRYLKELSINAPRLYAVQRGDSLWKMALHFYEDGYAFTLLKETNKLHSSHLRVGQILNIPLSYELCERVVNLDNIVRPGDSIYKIKKRKGS